MTTKDETIKETSCYSYEVVMVVQVLAENKESADEKLDKDGGYVSKRQVTLKDVSITEQQGAEYLMDDLKTFEKYVDAYCRDDINQNQFDALVSFCYNLGPNNLKSSTLLKKVNLNPSDPTILNEFLKWNKGGGRVLKGLTKRRQAESNLYFS
jgi:lysozyme